MNINGIDIQAADVIAVITILCGTILKLSGADGVVSTIMTMVVAYYFGKQYRVIKSGK
jgi:hypothetical protein